MASDEQQDPVAEIDRALLGSAPSLKRAEVAEQADLPLELAEELWQQLGFPRTGDDDVAFTEADVEALRQTRSLISLGILTPDSQAALVRTWGRSFARLAEWQVSLLTDLAVDAKDPEERLRQLMDDVLPNIQQLQAYVWRRHLASAANRMLATGGVDEPGTAVTMAVGFIDIVGYTSRAKNLSDSELVDWVEYFEDELTRIVVDLGGRVIKTIGDEVLFVADELLAATETGLIATERGEDDDDDFPRVRAGIAYGDVVNRLGDVFGPTVNIASRLTSVARPGTVLVDRQAYETLTADLAEERKDPDTGEVPALSKLLERAADELSELSPFTDAGDYRFRRMSRRTVKGYSRLEPFVIRRAKGAGPSD